jgi:predicted CopG family antitoxin
LVKTITIKDAVYKKLIAQKRKDESFSDLFERLAKNNLSSGIDALKQLRESTDFDKMSKRKFLQILHRKEVNAEFDNN